MIIGEGPTASPRAPGKLSSTGASKVLGSNTRIVEMRYSCVWTLRRMPYMKPTLCHRIAPGTDATLPGAERKQTPTRLDLLNPRHGEIPGRVYAQPAEGCTPPQPTEGQRRGEERDGAEALVPTSRECAARGGMHTTTAHGGPTEWGGEGRRRSAGPDLA